MATIREYFEKDFGDCFRVHCALPAEGGAIETAVLYDLASGVSFLSFYLPQKEDVLNFCRNMLSRLEFGRTQLNFSQQITLPSRSFLGEVRVENAPGEFQLGYRLFGDPKWRSTREVKAGSWIYIYSESDLSPDQVLLLQESVAEQGRTLQFRSQTHLAERSRFEVPLAFISHDSRDKEEVARPIAGNLQQRLCPVWYDEFSLRVGANLRQSIEKGLKECKKCVLVLSPAFFGNDGWTKKEFDSIFTREILEGSGLILPVWHGVTKQQVYDYSPSLLNIKGLDWSLGEEKVCAQLHREIIRDVEV